MQGVLCRHIHTEDKKIVPGQQDAKKHGEIKRRTVRSASNHDEEHKRNAGSRRTA